MINEPHVKVKWGFTGRSHNLAIVYFMPYQCAEKATFVRLIKNAQMQGARNPEE